ncbi:hypothetical protein JW921_11580 [Candidatus Fermentibacterales bacterium]|nr:hypothetical protein [Candidatus Fermentibacterales bacterium]
MARTEKTADPGRGFFVRWALVIALFIGLLCVLVLLVFGVLNRRLGFTGPQADETTEAPVTSPSLDSLSGPLVPSFSLPEVGEPEEYRGPEADWPLTPCSIYVGEGQDPDMILLDSFPEAPDARGIPYELHLLLLEWCRQNEYSDDDLARVYVFSSSDTIYVDLPRISAVRALEATIEGRFVCFTRLFLLVAGRKSEAYPEGLPLRGVPGRPGGP